MAIALAVALCLQGTELSARSLRQHVKRNLARSRLARQKSAFGGFVGRQGQRPASTLGLLQKDYHLGPTRVPHGYIVYGEGKQPDVLFDKSDPRIKRAIRSKAARLRSMRMCPWKKIERIQKIIHQKVKYAGNNWASAENTNAYSRFSRRMVDSGQRARLGDYLGFGQVVCREMAFLTQVALEDAGLKARLVGGSVERRGILIGHAWNEVQVKGRWYIVDTTNPQFNGVRPRDATTAGTSNGWIWVRPKDDPLIYRNQIDRQTISFRSSQR